MAVAAITLSGSTDGQPIAVAATASPGTTIHTAQAVAALPDILVLFASNINATTSRLLTIQWGGTAASNEVKVSIPPRSGLVPVVYMLPIENSLLVRAYADVANDVTILGTCYRVS